MFRRDDWLEPAPSRTEPIGCNSQPREKPCETLPWSGFKAGERRRVDDGEDLVNEGPGSLDADIASDRLRKLGPLPGIVPRRTPMMAGDGTKKGEAGRRRSPIRKKWIKPGFDSPRQQRVTSVVVRVAGRGIDIRA
jgi:hypothetical protein